MGERESEQESCEEGQKQREEEERREAKQREGVSNKELSNKQMKSTFRRQARPMCITITEKGQSLRKQISLERREEESVSESIVEAKNSPRDELSLKKMLTSLARRINSHSPNASKMPTNRTPKSLSPANSISHEFKALPISPGQSFDLSKQGSQGPEISLQVIRENEGELIKSALSDQPQPTTISIKVPRIAISDYFKEKYNYGQNQSDLQRKSITSPTSLTSRKLLGHNVPKMRVSQLNGVEEANKTIKVADSIFHNSKGFAALNRAKKINDSELAKQIWSEEMKAMRSLQLQKEREKKQELLLSKVKKQLNFKHQNEYQSFMNKHFRGSPLSLEGVWKENKVKDRRKEFVRKMHNTYYGDIWKRYKIPGSDDFRS